MIKVNTIKKRKFLFENNKYYEKKHTIKDSYNDKNCNDKTMVPN